MPTSFWFEVLAGYLASVLIEFLVLWPGLSKQHSLPVRVLSAVWLTACTYPIVVVALPILMRSQPEWLYLTVAESFAAVAECLLFGFAFGNARQLVRKPGRDDFAICLANLTSFGVGEYWLR